MLTGGRRDRSRYALLHQKGVEGSGVEIAQDREGPTTLACSEISQSESSTAGR